MTNVVIWSISVRSKILKENVHVPFHIADNAAKIACSRLLLIGLIVDTSTRRLGSRYCLTVLARTSKLGGA